MDESGKSLWRWSIGSFLIVVLVGLGLRYGTGILEKPNVRDEALMKIPIDDILQNGWTVETMIDYEEVKGPSFIWSYALVGEVFGATMNDMRLGSVLFFIGGAIPLLLIARRCGLSGFAMLAVGGLYCLLPYQAMLGQLLMSEASFNFFGLWVMWFFVWGFGESQEQEKRVWGPVLFAVGLSVLLHHRPHGVAFAGAAALVAFQRDQWRSWPWWLACVVAGLSRIPLWMRWGGLVATGGEMHYEEYFGFGLRLDSLVYLLAAAVPAIGVFLWPWFADRELRRKWWPVAVGAGGGLLLALVAMPDRSDADMFARFMGPINTGLGMVSGSVSIQNAVLLMLAMTGGAALGAMGVVVGAWPFGASRDRAESHSSETNMGEVVSRLAFWMLATGIPLYAVVRGHVFDRYLMVWTVLLPIVWVRHLPRWLLILQGLGLAGLLGFLVGGDLF